MINKKSLFSFLIIIIFFVFLLLISKNNNFPNIKGLAIAGRNIKVELATMRAEQEKGLSGRSSLAPDEGMLFVFSGGAPRFWMKDMNFPIDMIWIGEDLRVVYIKKDARPESYPETYGPASTQGGPDREAKYVL